MAEKNINEASTGALTTVLGLDGSGIIKKQNTITSASDTTSSNRLLTALGWMGLGGSTLAYTSAADFNTIDPTQFMSNNGTGSVPANSPGGAASFVGLNVKANATRALQVLGNSTATDKALWFRTKNTTWDVWRRVFDTSNSVGAVTQSGGAPTGALLEYATGASGSYWRFANNYQVCTRIVEYDALELTTSHGSLYRNASNFSYGFPASFAAGATAPSYIGGVLLGSDNAAIRGNLLAFRFRRAQSSIPLAWDGISIYSLVSAAASTGEITRFALFATGAWY